MTTSIYDNQNIPVTILDANGKFTYVNQAWCDWFGYTKDEVIGKTPRIIASGLHTPEFYKVMQVAINDPFVGVWQGHVTNKHKDGSLVPVVLTITARYDEDRKIVGHMGTYAYPVKYEVVDMEKE